VRVKAMLRSDSAERPTEPPPPAVSADNRTSVVVASIVALVLLAATAVVLTVQSVRDTDTVRAASGYRGELDGGSMFRQVAFDPEGTWLYAATGTTVEVRHPVTHRRAGAVFEIGSRVLTMVISPDGRRLVTVAEDNSVRVWDTESRQPVGEPLAAEGLTRAIGLAINPDSTLLAVAGDGGTALWNLADRRVVGLLQAANGSHSSVAFSPDGSRVATGDTGGGTVVLWSTDTRQPEGEPLVAHQPGASVNAVAFDRSGTVLADGSGDFVANVWNLTSREHSEFRGHEFQPIHSVILTADGRTMITASLNSMRIWDVQSVAEIGRTYGKDGSDDINDIALSPDGDTLAVIRDHRIEFWSLNGLRNR
jgi:WD40 repeat protein